MPYDENRDLEGLKAEIASRLRTACAHFPEAEFDALVDQIARIEMKYAGGHEASPASFRS